MKARFVSNVWLGVSVLLPLMAVAQEKEQRWDLRFESCFREGTLPLSVYARERGNRWISGVGSSIIPGANKYSFNRSYHPVDLSRAPIENGKMKGAVILYVTPDNWVPVSHRCFAVELEVEAAVGDGRMEGSWKQVKVTPEDPDARLLGKSGILSGTAKDHAPPLIPDNVTFTLNLAGAMPGGQPTYGDRTLTVFLGCQNGKPVSLRVGILGKGSRSREAFGVVDVPADGATVACDGDSVKGRLAFAFKNADEVPCAYTFDFDGRLMESFNVGTYRMTAVADGKTVEQTGSFDGRWSEGVRMAATTPADTRPWWTPVKGFKPVQPGEHPRLFFRKSDVAALRERARTPEGQAIIARLKVLLGGGEAMPSLVSPSTKAYAEKKPMPVGAYSFSHAAGFGLLYQLTGDRKYAELAKECFEWALAGKRNTDDRYAWKHPGGGLRAGPTIGWYAVAYDLAYQGWDEATRTKYAKAIFEYNYAQDGGDPKNPQNLESLVRGTQPPGSNHFGMQVGGAAIALLAVMGDPGVDDRIVQSLLRAGEASMIRNLSEGFGDGGFFAEGDGTGSMSSQIIFNSALQCWKNAKGMDFINVERSNARMTTLKWIYQTVVRNGRPDFWPIRGAYGHNVWDRDDLSGSGYFAIGMGAVTEEQRLAMKWYYDKYLAETDAKAGAPFDTVSRYPHVAISSFLNWPIGQEGREPAAVLPLCYRDSRFDFLVWRNRWQDADDVVISTLARTTQAGHYQAKAEGKLRVAAFGKKFDWGELAGESKRFASSPMVRPACST